MRINCPEKILKAIALLESNGYSAYAVGGCVRDSVMGRAPNDWDMTTSAAPDETREVFKNFRTVATGIKHGTVTVLIDSEPVEITTMRVDGKYSDNRHPESVSFTKESRMTFHAAILPSMQWHTTPKQALLTRSAVRTILRIKSFAVSAIRIHVSARMR